MVNHILQWLGTAALLGMYVVMNFYRGLHPLDTVLGLIGGLCYFTWSVRENNRPQQIVNAAGILVCVGGLIRYFG